MEKSKIKNLVLPNGDFVKGGWVSPPIKEYAGYDGLTEKAFSDVKESGVNLLFATIDPIKNPEEFDKFLTLCDKYEIYAVVPEESLGTDSVDFEKLFERIEKYKLHPSFFAISLWDEPGVDRFEIFETNIEILKQRDSQLKLYINNMPMYASAPQLFGGWWEGLGEEVTIEKYRTFLDSFYSKVDVDVVSYDFYPFRHEKGICHPKYFIQLCIAMDIAKKYKKPLWNFTQVTSWYRETIRTMTYSEIAWINNTAIACGVTGLQYFCYWTPKSTVEEFANAMISPTGYKTRSYYFVKKINDVLKNYMPKIVDAEYHGVIAFGDTICYFPEEYNLHTYGDIKQIVGEGELIGCFKKDGKNMYYLVNTSVTEQRVLEIIFKKEVSLLVNENGRESIFKGEHLVVSVTEGEAVLLSDIED